MAGNVKQEFDIDPKFANECGWVEFLSKECAYWIKESTGQKMTKFSTHKIKRFWRKSNLNKKLCIPKNNKKNQT